MLVCSHARRKQNNYTRVFVSIVHPCANLQKIWFLEFHYSIQDLVAMATRGSVEEDDDREMDPAVLPGGRMEQTSHEI